MPNNNLFEKTKTPFFLRSATFDTEHPANIKPLEGIIEGYGMVFNQRANIGNIFYEEIDAHALDNADLSDIKFLINHNGVMIPVARHRRGKRSTMDITVDNIGLFFRSGLDLESNATAKELCSAVVREDITDISFAFGIMVEGEKWYDLDKAMPLRRIIKISRVCELSAVNDGAYPQTSIYARSRASLDNEKIALDNAKAAALDNEKRRKDADSQAAFNLAKQKFLFVEEQKNYERET